MLMPGSEKFRQVCNPRFPARAQHPDSQKEGRGTRYIPEIFPRCRVSCSPPHLGSSHSYRVSEKSPDTPGDFFLNHRGICSFCQPLLAVAITPSPLCRRWLCPPRSMAGTGAICIPIPSAIMSPLSDRSLSSPKTPTQWQPRREDKGPGGGGKGGEEAAAAAAALTLLGRVLLGELLNLGW